MKEVVDFLQKSGVQYFATIGVDGKPKVRPFQFMFEENGKVWFCTSNQKRVYKELLEQPYIELCATGENMSWLRLGGKAIFSESLEIKEKVFEVSSLVRDVYQTTDNPDFEVFYLDELTATISNIGKPDKIFNL